MTLDKRVEVYVKGMGLSGGQVDALKSLIKKELLRCIGKDRGLCKPNCKECEIAVATWNQRGKEILERMEE